MRSGATSKPKSTKYSLADWILTLCASGRFGVREAVAAAIARRRKTKGPPVRRQGPQKTG